MKKIQSDVQLMCSLSLAGQQGVSDLPWLSLAPMYAMVNQVPK
jgi:hypothetical protein